MFEKQIEETVERILQERMDALYAESDIKIDNYVERYVRETLKGAYLITEPVDLVTKPGDPHVLLNYTPKTPSLVGGYVDLSGLQAEDTIELKVEVRLAKSWKWRKYFAADFSGYQKEPLYFFRDIFVPDGIKVSLTQKSGVGKHIYFVWYKRK